MSIKHIPRARRGRAALSNPAGRFDKQTREHFDDGWEEPDEPEPDRWVTEVRPDPARRIISRNTSPDVSFEASINPYRGCEHGCVYCFARPTHSFLDLSPGLDFETRLFYKENAAQKLEAELRKPGYVPTPLSLGINTDAYQPVERGLRVTRSLLEVLQAYRHPVSLLTKSSLILRDLDILTAMARDDLARAAVSITTLDDDIKRRLEPRTASPRARLKTIAALAAAGIPTGVMVAPIIPAITDHELEKILQAAAAAGARQAGYVLLRLPHEVAPLFREWLAEHYPDRAAHVMSLMQQLRGGKDYDSRWGTRMRGTGVFADLLQQRFDLACRQFALNEEHNAPGANCSLFRLPARPGDQGSLF